MCVGKRINIQGRIHTVIGVSDNGIIARLSEMHNSHPEGGWPGLMVLVRVAEELPEVISRNSFSYKP